MASTTSLGFPIVDNTGLDESMPVHEYLKLITGSDDNSVVKIAEGELLKRAKKYAKTAVEWEVDTTTVIDAGEFGYATDTNVIKFGDGVNVWADLEEYEVGSSASSIVESFLTSGDGNAYTVTVPGLTELTQGTSFYVKFHTKSTNVTPTLTVDGLGGGEIYYRTLSSSGSLSFTRSPIANWINQNSVYRVVYIGDSWCLPEFTLNTNTPQNILDGSSYGIDSVRTKGSSEESDEYHLGHYAFAEGCDTKASGRYSHAEGRDTTASGEASHAEGHYTVASGENQHVQGRCNIEDAENKYAHIVGNGEDVDHRSNAHTLDWNGVGWFKGGLKVGGTGQDDENAESVVLESVLNDYAKASDFENVAYKTDLDEYALKTDLDEYANGAANLLDGESPGSLRSINSSASYTDGYLIGENAVSLGEATKAYGEASFAEGRGSGASGFASHAEGENTIAASSHQHAQGKWNIADTRNKYAHIIGNGENDNARSNAHTVDWDGNAWFAGTVKVGGTGADDTEAVNVALKSDLEDYAQKSDFEGVVLKSDILTGAGVIKQSCLPSGYPYDEDDEIILPEITLAGKVVDETKPTRVADLPEFFEIVDGVTYIVTWNGVEYSCVGKSFENSTFLGDFVTFLRMSDHIDSSFIGSGEPFFIAPVFNESEFDGNGFVYAFDGSSEITISVRTVRRKHIDPKWLPQGYPWEKEGLVIAEKQNVAADNNFVLPINLTNELAIGESYQIKIGIEGEESVINTSPAKPFLVYELGEIGISAYGILVIGEEELGVHLISIYPDYTSIIGANGLLVFDMLALPYSESEEEFAITVEAQIPYVLNRLDPKFIPEEVALKSDLDGYVTDVEFENALDDYVLKTDLGNYVTDTEIEDVLDDYALKSDLNNGAKNILDGSMNGSIRSVNSAAEDGSYKIGLGATAFGTGTKASGQYSFANGWETTASNMGSHAEGISTIASGLYAHAEGDNTVASGVTSHSEGVRTIASGDGQHVQGKYNIEDTEDRYVHIIGNGNSDVRSNAHTVDWGGNAWYKGTVKVGGTSYDDAQEVALKSDLAGLGGTITMGTEDLVAGESALPTGTIYLVYEE